MDFLMVTFLQVLPKVRHQQSSFVQQYTAIDGQNRLPPGLRSPHAIANLSSQLHVHIPDKKLTFVDENLHPTGTTWKVGSFCEDFLERRYHSPVSVCKENSNGGPSQIRCFWNPANAHAATCDIDNMMVQPRKLWKAMQDVQGLFPHSGSVWLLNNPASKCSNPTIHK